MTLKDIDPSDFLSKHGPWCVICLIMFFGMYRLANWAEPKMDMIIENHVQFLSKTEENLNATTKAIEATNQLVQETASGLMETNKTLSETSNLVKEIHQKVSNKESSK